VATQKPGVIPTSLNQFFWASGADGRLRIQRCSGCGRYTHPPAPICSSCECRQLAPAIVSGRGQIYTFTTVRHAFHPGFAGDLPYVVAIVELVEQPGLHLITRIVDIAPQAVMIGMEVAVTFERNGAFWLPLFRPASGEAEQAGSSGQPTEERI
jgi:uncharacterized OB-fold protein